MLPGLLRVWSFELLDCRDFSRRRHAEVQASDLPLTLNATTAQRNCCYRLHLWSLQTAEGVELHPAKKYRFAKRYTTHPLVCNGRMESLQCYILPCDHGKSHMPFEYSDAWRVAVPMAGHGAGGVGRRHLVVHSSFHRLCK